MTPETIGFLRHRKLLDRFLFFITLNDSMFLMTEKNCSIGFYFKR
jgi:hypothetical protein